MLSVKALPWALVMQVKYILGLKIPRADKLVEQMENIFGALDQFK